MASSAVLADIWRPLILSRTIDGSSARIAAGRQAITVPVTVKPCDHLIRCGQDLVSIGNTALDREAIGIAANFVA